MWLHQVEKMPGGTSGNRVNANHDIINQGTLAKLQSSGSLGGGTRFIPRYRKKTFKALLDTNIYT
jgi:hypothetical protein